MWRRVAAAAVLAMAGCGGGIDEPGAVVMLGDAAIGWADVGKLDAEARRFRETETLGYPDGGVYLDAGTIVRVLGPAETPDGHPVVRVTVERPAAGGDGSPGDVLAIERGQFEGARTEGP